MFAVSSVLVLSVRIRFALTVAWNPEDTEGTLSAWSLLPPTPHTHTKCRAYCMGNRVSLAISAPFIDFITSNCQYSIDRSCSWNCSRSPGSLLFSARHADRFSPIATARELLYLSGSRGLFNTS